jgi:tetratricopeptide (TPR) repeat protein
MIIKTIIFIWIFLSLMAAAEKHEQNSIQKLIGQLSNENFSERSATELKIWQQGEDAIKDLQVSSQSDDPEIAERSKRVLKKITLGITPETPPDILSQIESYPNSSLEEKQNMIKDLFEKGSGEIALRLYTLDSNNKGKKVLLPLIESYMLSFARDAICNGGVEEANNYLKELPDSYVAIRAIAWQHFIKGNANKEIKALENKNDRRSIAMKNALLRLKGDKKSVIDFSIKNQLPKQLCSFQLLAGNPIPWLELQSNRSKSNVTKLYHQLVIKKWQTNELDQTLINQIPQANAQYSGDPSETETMNTLFALGLAKEGVTFLGREKKIDLFLYYIAQEKFDDALKSINLNSQLPNFNQWLDKRFDILINNSDTITYEADEIPAMLSFLDKKRIDEPIIKVVIPKMLVLSEKNNDLFAEILGKCCQENSSVNSAMKIAQQYAGEDNLKWNSVLDIFLTKQPEISQWWKWLEEIDSECTKANRFQKMLILFQRIPDQNQEMVILKGKISQSLKNAEEKNKINYENLEFFLADFTKDLEKLTTKNNRFANEEQVAEYTLRLGRWKEAAVAYKKLIEQNPKDYSLLAKLAVASRLSGDENNALTAEKRMSQLVLGDCDAMLILANIYNIFGDKKRADRWEKYIIHTSIPGSSIWINVLNREAKKSMLDGNWESAASMNESFLSWMINSSRVESITYLRQRIITDIQYALSIKNKNQAISEKIIRESHDTLMLDGSLSDDFFPSLRKAGLTRLHDELFQKSWDLLLEIEKQYPNDDNLLNSAAWMASRAMLKIDEANMKIIKALELRPNQGAYLDTLAEIFFVKGDRNKALNYSAAAVRAEPLTDQLREQYFRFLREPLPKNRNN